MSRLRLATAILAALALTACSKGDSLTGPTGTGTRDTPVPGGPRDGGLPGTSGGGDTTSTSPGDTTSTNPPDTTGAGDPVSNGTWITPDSTVISRSIRGRTLRPGAAAPAPRGAARR